jgi:hypothetical protein
VEERSKFAEIQKLMSTPLIPYRWTGGGVDVYTSNIRGRVYPQVSGLAAWSQNCKWYSFQPLGAVVPLFCESV